MAKIENRHGENCEQRLKAIFLKSVRCLEMISCVPCSPQISTYKTENSMKIGFVLRKIFGFNSENTEYGENWERLP